ncbi:MAG: radical SAM protein [Pseudomonadota bacterium]
MNSPAQPLTPADHDREAAGMRYVYPVVSRRAAGVSVGINLNPNNACNWRCIYCQVPDLRRGGPPAIDLARLERELHEMLTAILHGDFMQRHVPEGMRRLNDIALSGNGEPTSAREFPEVIDLVGRVIETFGLTGAIKLVLITNGSLAHRPAVQAGIRRMAGLNGEVWFKFDRATASGMRRVNDTTTRPEAHFKRLGQVAALCPTWIQTCMFALDGAPPDEAELAAYLDMLRQAVAARSPIEGVLLYGLARQPMQPEAVRLSPLPPAWLEALARRIEEAGLPVRLTP